MQPLIEPLKDSHTVIINGQRKHFLISQIVFLPEGLGAATRMRELKAQRSLQPLPSFAALDFGGGNCSIVGLNVDGGVAGFAQTTPGVLALYADIAAAIAADNGGIAPTDDAVRLGIELGTYRLGGYGKTDFKALYENVLPKWISTRLSEIRAKAGDILDRSAVKVVCGGGANLPGLMSHLPKDYAQANNPQQLESQGLLEYARRAAVMTSAERRVTVSSTIYPKLEQLAHRDQVTVADVVNAILLQTLKPYGAVAAVAAPAITFSASPIWPRSVSSCHPRRLVAHSISSGQKTKGTATESEASAPRRIPPPESNNENEQRNPPIMTNPVINGQLPDDTFVPTFEGTDFELDYRGFH